MFSFQKTSPQSSIRVITKISQLYLLQLSFVVFLCNCKLQDGLIVSYFSFFMLKLFSSAVVLAEEVESKESLQNVISIFKDDA